MSWIKQKNHFALTFIEKTAKTYKIVSQNRAFIDVIKFVSLNNISDIKFTN